MTEDNVVDEFKKEVTSSKGSLPSQEEIPKRKPSSGKKSKVKKAKGKVEVKFECGFAQPGESTVAFTHKDKTFNLSLKNKIWILPDTFDDTEKAVYREALLANGFMDVTVNHGIKFDKETGKCTYKAMHPDHTDKNRINATIGLNLIGDDGKPIYDKNGQQKTAQATICEGIVITQDKLIYEALIKAGFYHAGIQRG